MKAQDYVDKHLPKISKTTSEEELKTLTYNAFMEFNDEVVEIVEARNTTRDKAVISIIKEVGQKWNKFCRIINQQQEHIALNENLFISHWKKQLGF